MPRVPFEVLVSLAPVVPFVVAPLEPPSVVRHCPRCGRDRPFTSSDRFRVNAQKRRLDVWLIRWCVTCGSTWNQPVHERVSPESLGARLEGYHANDPDLVVAVAFDEPALRRFGRVEPATFRVDRVEATPPFAARFERARPFAVPLERVVCAALGLSRSGLRSLVRAERIVTPAGLDRDLADGTVVWVGGPASRAEVA